MAGLMEADQKLTKQAMTLQQHLRDAETEIGSIKKGSKPFSAERLATMDKLAVDLREKLDELRVAGVIGNVNK